MLLIFFFFFFSSRRRHTRSDRDWSSDVCSSDLGSLGDRRQRSAHGQQFLRRKHTQPKRRIGLYWIEKFVVKLFGDSEAGDTHRHDAFRTPNEEHYWRLRFRNGAARNEVAVKQRGADLSYQPSHRKRFRRKQQHFERREACIDSGRNRGAPRDRATVRDHI